MKNALRYTLLVLSVALPAAAFGGLVGVLPPSAFVFSEAALFLFALAGVVLIGLDDHGRGRRPLVLRRAPPAVAPCPVSVGAFRRRSSYGIRRRERRAA